MYGKIGVSLIAALAIVGCSDSDRADGDGRARIGATDTTASQFAETTPGDTAAMPAMDMAGMDHGGMSGQSEMPEMDHGAVPEGQATADGMEGMDHSQMPGMSGTQRPAPDGSSEMDHSQMSRMEDQAAPPENMQGMDHSGMAGMRHEAAAASPLDGMDKLRMLVAELVKDPVVQQEIQSDSVLREQWTDPGVRRVILQGQPIH